MKQKLSFQFYKCPLTMAILRRETVMTLCRFLIVLIIVLVFCQFVLQLQDSGQNDKGIKAKPRYSILKKLKRNPTGSWSGDDAKQYHAERFAEKLNQRLITFFLKENVTSVVDLGGGGGHHVRNFNQHGIFASCYDGNPASQTVSDGVCAVMDLTEPMNLAKYDWVLSLSVGRQIPVELQQNFISNVHNLNRKGVAMYWGDGLEENSARFPHTIKDNTQVKSIFEGLGYTYDENATNFVRGKKPKDIFYSILVFRKKEKK